jgi:DNA-binding transcriptional MerR regulator
MKLILRGRKYGFSLEEIRQWLMLYEQDGTSVQAEAFIALADRQLAALQQQKLELDEAIRGLSDLRSQTFERAQARK